MDITTTKSYPALFFKALHRFKTRCCLFDSIHTKQQHIYYGQEPLYSLSLSGRQFQARDKPERP
jgi:hypothetical protein